MVKLDIKDKKILVLLSENARMPISELAKNVQLSRDTVSYRIKRLQKLGVILRFYPEIDFRQLRHDIFHIFLLIDESNEAKYKELELALKGHPNTLSVIEYTDRWDLEWVLAAKSLEEFDSVATEFLARFSSIIMAKSKLVVINTYYSVLLPYHFHEGFGENKKLEGKKESHDADKKDLDILRALSENCRLSTYEIAKKVNLSPDAIGIRIKRLVKSGIIKKFTISADFPSLGYSLYTFKLQMKVFNKKSEALFKSFVEKHPNIIKAVKTLGGWDLIIYVIAENPKEFHRVIKEIRNNFPEVKSYDTLVAYSEHLFKPLPDTIKI